jgi:hypothetical protein
MTTTTPPITKSLDGPADNAAAAAAGKKDGGAASVLVAVADTDSEIDDVAEFVALASVALIGECAELVEDVADAVAVAYVDTNAVEVTSDSAVRVLVTDGDAVENIVAINDAVALTVAVASSVPAIEEDAVDNKEDAAVELVVSVARLPLAQPLQLPRTRLLSLALALPQALPQILPVRDAPLVPLAALESAALTVRDARSVGRVETVLLLQLDAVPLRAATAEAVSGAPGDGEERDELDADGELLREALPEDECVELPLSLPLPLALSLPSALPLGLPLVLPLTLPLPLPLPLSVSTLLSRAGCEKLAGKDDAVELGVSTVGVTRALPVETTDSRALLVDFIVAAELRDAALVTLAAPEVVMLAERAALCVGDDEVRAVFVTVATSEALPHCEAVSEASAEGACGGDAERRGEPETEGEAVQLSELMLVREALLEPSPVAESAGDAESEVVPLGVGLLLDEALPLVEALALLLPPSLTEPITEGELPALALDEALPLVEALALLLPPSLTEPMAEGELPALALAVTLPLDVA